MSRITGSDALKMFEAYAAVYAPQELTEEQVWEEVENWVNSLVEEGYDLSEFTWEEMYEEYLNEMGQRATTGQMTAPRPVTSPRPAPAATPVTTRYNPAGGGMGGGRGSGSSPGGIRPTFQNTGGYGRYAPPSMQQRTPAPAARPVAGAPLRQPASNTPSPRPTASPRPTSSPRPTASPAPAGGSAPAPSAPTAARPSLSSQADEIRKMRAASLQRQGRTLDAATVSASTRPAYQANSFDPFDAIKGHLIDEGYADTEEAALKIMANMSEEWRESIIEELNLNNLSLQEEEARQGSLFTKSGKPQDFRNPKKVPFTATDPTPTPASRRLPAASSGAPKTSPGQLEIPEPKTTKVSGSQFRNAGEARQGSLFTKSGKPQNFTGGRTPFVATEPVKATKRLPAASPEASKTSPGQQVIRQTSNPPTTKALPPGQKGGSLALASTPKPARIPEIKPVSVRDVTSKSKTLPAAGQTSATKLQAPVGKPPAGPKIKVPSGLSKAGKVAGRVLGPAAAALDVADERAKGSGWVRSLAKGAAVAAGGALGGAAGSVAGPVGSIGGAAAGSMAASKAFDVAAGANAKERAAMATANRQRQAGTAIKGIGGQTTFSQKKPGGPAFMSTGSGSQRKTVQLAKTGVVQRGGQSTAGHLAFKGGKAVYKAGPSAQSLAKTSSNPLERVGRTLFAGAYKKHDVAKSQQALQKARQSDVARNKKLGVKAKPAG